MVTVTFSAETIDQAVIECAKFVNVTTLSAGMTTKAVAEENVKPEKINSKVKKQEPGPIVYAPGAVNAPVGVPTAGAGVPTPPVPPAPTVTQTAEDQYAAIRKNIEKQIPLAVKACGREKVIAVLAEFGAKKGGELKTDQYGPFLTRLSGLTPTPSI